MSFTSGTSLKILAMERVAGCMGNHGSIKLEPTELPTHLNIELENYFH